MEREERSRELLVRSISELGLNFTEEMIEQFMLYIEQLLHWTKVTNLTSITDPDEIVSKHFVDSLTALAATSFPSRATVIDVGTGAGFPGIPLKIARSDLRLVLIEPTQKKCSFLRSIVGALKLTDVSIFAGTLQQYIVQPAYVAGDLIVLRAIRFEEIDEQVMGALNKTGKIILYRADKIGISSVPSGYSIEQEKPFVLPANQGNRVVSILAKSRVEGN